MQVNTRGRRAKNHDDSLLVTPSFTLSNRTESATICPSYSTYFPMKTARLLIQSFLCLSFAFTFSSCATLGRTKKVQAPNPVKEDYQRFTAQPDYPKTYAVWKNDELLAATNSENAHIKINLASQRGFLMNGDEIVIDYPICSGTKSRPTPKGTFYIKEKIVNKSSNRYGKMYDVEGKVVHRDADSFKDAIPEGGWFMGAQMHYFMRLTDDGVGHHIGPVLRHPASHACVRGPSKIVPIVYSKVKTGTKVEIE